MTIAAGLNSISTRFAVVAIGLYQKYLSPVKGFVCAHRVLHGGDSCSEYARRGIQTHGIRKGIDLLRKRLVECRTACEILTDRREIGSFTVKRSEELVNEEPDEPESGKQRPQTFLDPACCNLDPSCCNTLGSCEVANILPTQAAGDACVGAGCDGAAGADCAGCEAIGACA